MVWNRKAKIALLKDGDHIDATGLISGGPELAQEAVEVFGKGINIPGPRQTSFGLYPPTEKIVTALAGLRRKS